MPPLAVPGRLLSYQFMTVKCRLCDCQPPKFRDVVNHDGGSLSFMRHRSSAVPRVETAAGNELRPSTRILISTTSRENAATRWIAGFSDCHSSSLTAGNKDE